jgi:hypothetical protein
MVNEPDAEAVMAKRLALPIGYLILMILIFLPVMHMKMENLPLVIDLAVLSSAFAATSLLFYYESVGRGGSENQGLQSLD